MKELLEYIVKSIVNNPDAVSVSERESVDFAGLTIYTISVAQEDKGVLIGRKGRTINAIRDLATIAAIRLQKRVKVFVEEDDRSSKEEANKEDLVKSSTDDMLDDNLDGISNE